MATGILRGLISVLGGKVGTLLLGLLISPLLVRLLGSSLYGDYAFVLSLLSITMIIVNAGIFDGARKYITEKQNQPDWPEQVLGFYLRVASLLAVTVALGYVIFSYLGLSAQYFDSDFTVYFYLLGGLVIGRQAFSLARSGLMGLGMEEKSEPLRVIQKVIFGGFGLFLAYHGYGVAGVLVGHIISVLVVSVIAFAILFRNLEIRTVFSGVSDSLPKRELLSYNGLNVILILLTYSLYHTDILLLKPIAGSQATGYYRVALIIAELLWFVPNALQMMFLHSSSELWSEGKSRQITSLASKATRYNLALSLLLVIGLAVLASDFIPLYYGSEFKRSTLPLLILLPGAFGFALARPIFAIGQGKGELRILIIATATAALLNLALNILLIPHYGMTGAAMATSTSYGSMLVLHVLAARRIGFNPIKDLRILRIIAVGLTTAPIIYWVASGIDSSLVSLVIVPPLGFGIYAYLSVKINVITSEEVGAIVERLPINSNEYI